VVCKPYRATDRHRQNAHQALALSGEPDPLIHEVDAMLFLLTNRTRANLTATHYAELAVLARAFYASIPADVKILGEWAAVDQSRNYTLLEAPDIETVRRIQAPFAMFTETEIVPVTTISGWTAA
jgi:hypothetical protein